MKILVVGGGGREHALAWKLSTDSARPQLFCAPGNAGTAEVAANLKIDADDIPGLLAWARSNKPHLTIVGPEAPLCSGIVDRFTAEGFRVFGPAQAAAQLEGSKIFAKEIMEAAGVPTAHACSFRDAEEARAYVAGLTLPVVLKADGLAAGKGVVICASREEAERTIDEVMVRKVFGDAGRGLVVEEFLSGEEASILALVDGEHVVMLASSQDHKRALNNDEGPNTGGMGAYSPAPVVTDDLWPVIRRQIFDRVLAELRRRGIVYRGVLYAGVMIGAGGVRVLEFNCRFGDPETQAIIPRIEGDLLPALDACVDGTLSERMIRWRKEVCVCVVMASGGYPGPYEKGKVVRGLDEARAMKGVVVFHAGTALQDGKIVTAGGRVLGVTALGGTLKQAVKLAYRAVLKTTFDQAHYRTDIAMRALNRS